MIIHVPGKSHGTLFQIIKAWQYYGKNVQNMYKINKCISMEHNPKNCYSKKHHDITMVHIHGTLLHIMVQVDMLIYHGIA